MEYKVNVQDRFFNDWLTVHHNILIFYLQLHAETSCLLINNK